MRCVRSWLRSTHPRAASRRAVAAHTRFSTAPLIASANAFAVGSAKVAPGALASSRFVVMTGTPVASASRGALSDEPRRGAGGKGRGGGRKRGGLGMGDTLNPRQFLPRRSCGCLEQIETLHPRSAPNRDELRLPHGRRRERKLCEVYAVSHHALFCCNNAHASL